jgi:eukaryotic-like serine/threonine-protein kinase
MGLVTGERVGRYQIDALLGSGGMGDVYRAADVELRRPVAIKVLHDDCIIGDPTQMVREARACAALQHPHICVLHDIGVHQGRDYLVFEFLEGETLAVRLQRGGLPVADVLRFATQLADAVAAAHSSGIRHGDLKPQNVVIVKGICKVVDFGLASRFTTAVGGASDTTQTSRLGVVRGTVPYMSPEQLRGDAGQPSDDVFALGAMLYEMLSGQRAFDGLTDATIMGAILHGQPQWSVLESIGVPSNLARVPQDCLNKRTSDRPHAEQVAQRLREISLSGAAAIDSATPSRSHALSLGLIPFICADQQASATALEIFEPELRRLGNLRIVRASEGLGSDPCLETVARDLRANLLLTGVVDRAADHTIFRVRVLDPPAKRQLYAQTFAERSPNYVASAQRVARSLVQELSAVLSRPVRPAQHHEGSSRARELYIEGRYHWNRRTRQGNDKAIASFMEAIEEDCLWALPYAGVADCHTTVAIAGWGDLRSNYDRAKAAAYKAIELDSTVAEPHATLGNVYWVADWNWRAAEDEFRSALALNPGYGEAYLWYGRHLSLRGQHEAAIENLNVAWKLDPLSRAVNLAIGTAWYAARQFEIASAHLDAIIRENPSWCNALYFAGMSNLMLGRIDLAIATLKTAIETDHTTRRPLVGLAQAYWMAGETQAARLAFDELTARDSSRYLSPCDAAEVLAVFGDEQGALEWLRKAVDERCADLAGLRVDPMYDSLRNNAAFRHIEALVFGDA